MTCFVPNCNNSIGMPFPDDEDLKKAWLESLSLSDEPTEKSFVCLDHFGPSDIIANDEDLQQLQDTNLNSENVRGLVILKKGAIPTIFEDCYVFPEETNACRVCNSSDNLEMSIFDTIDCGTTVSSMIMLCCYPIVIRKTDLFPKYICVNCMKQLYKCFKFRSKCLKTNNLLNEKRKIKRKVSETVEYTSKKICLDPSETNDDLTAILTDESVEKTNELVDILSGEIIEETIKVDEPILVPVPKKDSLKKTNIDKIERELERMYESADVPITEKKSLRQKSLQSEKLSKKVLPISLPKGIRITNTPKQNYTSDKGIFSCAFTTGLQDSVFAIADDYLLTFGLIKGNTRFLRCVIPTCNAKGEQQVSFEDEQNLVLKVPHNHERPDEQTRKKQMFFHIMRKRMQVDKSLNIRLIYEEICKQEPDIRKLVPLRNVINEICKHQIGGKLPVVRTFDDLFDRIEDDAFERLHFTCRNKQFYQEKFSTEDGALAVVFSNTDVIDSISDSKLMYVDASFKIHNNEDFGYHLVTVLVWVDESYYPILYALINKKTQEIFSKIFRHLHDVLGPALRPNDIVTDYESSLYYALGETYLEAHIGGSVYYYTQNVYKKVCALNLAKELETNSNFRNVYHMLLMLPLLPVNTIPDALNTITVQARDFGISDLTDPLFEHVRTQWLENVTPRLFCVHRLENRINENVIAPFKKLRDFLLLFKGKVNPSDIRATQVIEKLIELEAFLHEVYSRGEKKSFSRDLSSFQKKNVLRAWQHIETHPKININSFFQKVLGYIKCMENQLWIWGFYGFAGDADDVLITAGHSVMEDDHIVETDVEYSEENVELPEGIEDDPTLVMEAVIDDNGAVVLESDVDGNGKHLEKALLTYVHYE